MESLLISTLKVGAKEVFVCITLYQLYAFML